MDMTLLLNELALGAIQTPQEFTDLAVTIFQNAIDYNAKHEGMQVLTHVFPKKFFSFFFLLILLL